jgi:hypothetical protein
MSTYFVIPDQTLCIPTQQQLRDTIAKEHLDDTELAHTIQSLMHLSALAHWKKAPNREFYSTLQCLKKLQVNRLEEYT